MAETKFGTMRLTNKSIAMIKMIWNFRSLSNIGWNEYEKLILKMRKLSWIELIILNWRENLK